MAMRKLVLPLVIAVAAVAVGSAPHLDGSARLIAFEAVPDAQSCEWSPEDAARTQLDTIAGYQRANGGAAITPVSATTDEASRKPLRWIQDPNASFSSMAVDNVRN